MGGVGMCRDLYEVQLPGNIAMTLCEKASVSP